MAAPRHDLKRRIRSVVRRCARCWARRHLPENQRNPGAGKKRLYSRLDIARIAAIQTLTSVGVSAAAAAQITERLQSGPTADPWKQALAQAAPHIYVFIADGGAVPAVYAGNDETEVGRILKRLQTDPAAVERRVAVFDVGPDVSRALQSLDGKQKRPADPQPPLPDASAAWVPPDSPPPSPPAAFPPGFQRGPWRRLS